MPDPALYDRALEMAHTCANTPLYLENPLPANLSDELTDDFCRMCFIPRSRQEDLQRVAGHPINVLELVSTGYAAAREAGALRNYEGRVMFPVPLLCADGVTPVEVSMARQGYDRPDLMPWYVNYVGYTARTAPVASVAPSKEIERFAWLGAWPEFLRQLADYALAEQWDFEDVPDENGHRFAILKSYICTTFFRLAQEDKIAITPDRSFAAFNTGLVNSRYDDIYACFEPNTGHVDPAWRFAGFAAAGSRGLGKQLVSLFNPLPTPALYFERIEEVLFDLKRELIVDYDHIIIDNMARLPLDFLAEELRGCADAADIVEELRSAHEPAHRAALYSELGELVSDDDRSFRRLRSGVADAVDTACRRVRWNFKTAIPSYYPRANSMSLLLPLCLLRDNAADAALVVQLMPSGNYQGQTILTMRQAYTNARLICRPDSDWLTTSPSALAEGEEDEE